MGEGQLMLAPNGTLGLAFLGATADISNEGSCNARFNHYKFDIYGTLSTDNGATWLTPVILNSVRSYPDMTNMLSTNCKNVLRPIGMDYMWSDATVDNKFVAYWPDYRPLGRDMVGTGKLY